MTYGHLPVPVNITVSEKILITSITDFVQVKSNKTSVENYFIQIHHNNARKMLAPS